MLSKAGGMAAQQSSETTLYRLARIAADKQAQLLSTATRLGCDTIPPPQGRRAKHPTSLHKALVQRRLWEQLKCAFTSVDAFVQARAAVQLSLAPSAHEQRAPQAACTGVGPVRSSHAIRSLVLRTRRALTQSSPSHPLCQGITLRNISHLYQLALPTRRTSCPTPSLLPPRRSFSSAPTSSTQPPRARSASVPTLKFITQHTPQPPSSHATPNIRALNGTQPRLYPWRGQHQRYAKTLPRRPSGKRWIALPKDRKWVLRSRGAVGDRH